MFGSSQHKNGLPRGKSITIRYSLQAFEISCSQRCDNLCALTIAFVGTAPAHILHNCHDWSEVPGDTSSKHLFGSRAANFFHQCRVIRRTEPDVMWKDSCIA